jgi:hypothetical protein
MTRLLGLESSQSRLVRLGVIVGVLAAAGLLARSATPSLLIMLGGGLGVVFLMRHPMLGLMALLVSALIVPFAIGTGTLTPLNITVLLIPVLLIIWIADMVRRRSIRLADSPTSVPLLAFVVVSTVSLIAGNLRWSYFADLASLPAQLGGWAVFVLSAGIFLLVANQVVDRQWLERITWLFLGLSGILVAGRILPALGGVTERLWQHGADGSMFWTWLAAMAFGQFVFNERLEWKRKLALGLLVAAGLYIGWFQSRDWVSGWLPPLAAIVTIIWLRSWRIGLLFAVAGVVIIFAFYSTLPSSLVATDRYSIDTRIAAAQVLVQVLKANPILGLGPSNYYQYTLLFPILGWYVRFNSHNQYIDIIAQTGIVGFSCFFWFVAEVSRVGWRLRNRCWKDFDRGYVYACLGGLVGMLVAGVLADWFLPFVYNIGLAGFRSSLLAWLFLGGLVSLEQVVTREAQGEGSG